MNSTMQRRLALVGLTMLAGAAISVGGGTAASAATVSAPHHGTVVVAHPGHGNTHTRPARRWVAVDDFDTRRACVRAGLRGLRGHRHQAWTEFKCVRDHRGGRNDWDRGGWDRRGNRHHHSDYTLWVKRSWHR